MAAPSLRIIIGGDTPSMGLLNPKTFLSIK
jgi:hypothetical protein